MYARLNWATMDFSMFKNGQADWPRMKAGFEQMMKEYPDAWNTNNFAKFACIAKDHETLSALIPKIGDAPIAEAWEDNVNIYRGCQKWAAAMVQNSRR
jgi:hypothetical protein